MRRPAGRRGGRHSQCRRHRARPAGATRRRRPTGDRRPHPRRHLRPSRPGAARRALDALRLRPGPRPRRPQRAHRPSRRRLGHRSVGGRHARRHHRSQGRTGRAEVRGHHRPRRGRGESLCPQHAEEGTRALCYSGEVRADVALAGTQESDDQPACPAAALLGSVDSPTSFRVPVRARRPVRARGCRDRCPAGRVLRPSAGHDECRSVHMCESCRPVHTYGRRELLLRPRHARSAGSWPART